MVSFLLNLKSTSEERYRSGHNEAVLKTVCPQGRVGSNPTLSAGQTRGLPKCMGSKYLLTPWLSYRFTDVQALVLCRSTQEAEGTPLERVQVVNSGARVQIPPSALRLREKTKIEP